MDADSGLLLPRRAPRVLKLDASTRVGPWQVSPQWQLSSRRYGDAAHRSQLAGYGRLDVQANAHFAPAWELMLGVDNVTDRHYRLNNSRSGPGRAWRVRLRWAPDRAAGGLAAATRTGHGKLAYHGRTSSFPVADHGPDLTHIFDASGRHARGFFRPRSVPA